MKKKVLSLLLTLCLVMTFVPMAAFAAEANKISITTVDELLQFAKAVDNGEYDDKTDAVVSLDADLDLTNVAWKPIGSVFVKRKCEQKGPKKVSTFSTRFHVVSNVFPKYQMLTF